MKASLPLTDTTFRLETERLVLRQMQEADAEDMVLLNSDPEVVRYTGDGPFENLEEARQLVRNYTQYRLYRRGRWLMHEKSTGDFVGWCGLKFLEAENETDLGYRLLRRHWNKGYATEASRAALAYGFGELGLQRIIGRAVPENVASVKVLLKMGMQYEKDVHEHGQQWAQYALTREQWLQVK